MTPEYRERAKAVCRGVPGVTVNRELYEAIEVALKEAHAAGKIEGLEIGVDRAEYYGLDEEGQDAIRAIIERLRGREEK